MTVVAIVLAALAGDFVLAIGFGRLLGRASGQHLPRVDLENNWSKTAPRAVQSRLPV